MKKPSYSIIIRTLGKAGTMYRTTLDCIASQTLQPEEILIVIPHGYEPPKETLGYERIVYSPKGMLSQNITGMKEAKGEWLLLLDDDMKFSHNFVEELFKTVERAQADVAIPIVTDIKGQTVLSPKSFGENLAGFIMGVCFHSNKQSEYLLRCYRTSGFIVQARPDSKDYLSQTGAGACRLLRKEAAQNMHFEEELYLEKEKYPSYEDQVFFYKLYKMGYRIAVNKDVLFLHLDAMSSRTGEKQLLVAYAHAKEAIIFWHRFIYLPENKLYLRLWSILCIWWRIQNTLLITGLKSIATPTNFHKLKYYLKAYRDAFVFIKSKEYRSIPRIISCK